MDDLSDRTFRYQLPTWRRIGVPIAAVIHLACAALVCVLFAHIAARLSSAPGGAIPMSPGLTCIMLVPAAGSLACACALLARALLDRRLEANAEVHATRVSLVVSERPGQAESILWEEVEELRVAGGGPATADRALPLDIRGAGKRIRIPFFVEENLLLREIIIQRAGLASKRETWRDTRFTRPSEEQA